jgi:cytosine/adenosine deaminase-related metal-dependent hydrolase
MTCPHPILFQGATLLPGGGDWLPRKGIDVLVQAGRIAAIDAAPQVPPDTEVVPAAGLLLLPAFVNAHTHSPEALARGRAPMARLDAWLAAEYAEGLDGLDAAAIRRAVLISAAEAVRGGAVAVTDHFRQIPPSVEALRTAAAAWAEGGIRARVALMLRDLPSPTASVAPPSTAEALAIARAALAARPMACEIGLGPSAPQRCSDALLRGLADLARDAGAFLHLHVCETAKDRADIMARFGQEPVAALEALGVAGDSVEYAHCVHLSDTDLNRMAAAGTRFLHNPVANLRLGSGIAPVARARARGVTVRIGTDGPGSNDTQDMLEAAKLALLLPRAGRPDAEWPEPAAVLEMATGSHRLEPGANADLIAFDPRAPGFVTTRADEWLPRLLLATRALDLVHVLGGGAWLLRDRALVPACLREVAA